MTFEQSEGRRILLYGKYSYSGKVRRVEGKWLILDDAWQHFWADAEKRVRNTSEPPIYLGDDTPVNLDYVEAAARNLAWADDEDKLSPTATAPASRRR